MNAKKLAAKEFKTFSRHSKHHGKCKRFVANDKKYIKVDEKQGVDAVVTLSINL